MNKVYILNCFFLFSTSFSFSMLEADDLLKNQPQEQTTPKSQEYDFETLCMEKYFSFSNPRLNFTKARKRLYTLQSKGEQKSLLEFCIKHSEDLNDQDQEKIYKHLTEVIIKLDLRDEEAAATFLNEKVKKNRPWALFIKGVADKKGGLILRAANLGNDDAVKHLYMTSPLNYCYDPKVSVKMNSKNFENANFANGLLKLSETINSLYFLSKKLNISIESLGIKSDIMCIKMEKLSSLASDLKTRYKGQDSTALTPEFSTNILPLLKKAADLGYPRAKKMLLKHIITTNKNYLADQTFVDTLVTLLI